MVAIASYGFAQQMMGFKEPNGVCVFSEYFHCDAEKILILMDQSMTVSDPPYLDTTVLEFLPQLV